MKAHIPIYVISALIAISIVRAQAQEDSEKLVTLEDVARSVTYLHTPTPSVQTSPSSTTVYEIGTGFIVDIQQHLFLVTANHVATITNPDSLLTFGLQDDTPHTVKLVDLSSTKKLAWEVHKRADVAVLPLNPSENDAALISPRELHLRLFISKLEAPPRSRIVTVVGFPLGLGVRFTGPDSKISPVSQEAKPSSGLITLNRFDTKTPCDVFLLDNPGIGGFSGAPLFILPGTYTQGPGIAFSRTTLFVGLMHGTVADKTGGKLAVVVPSSFVVETLKEAYKKVVTGGN